jgi:ABC-2 type transport system permease protein
MIKRKGFIIITIAFPALALLAMGVYQIISQFEKPQLEEVKIGYIDESGIFTDYTHQGNITLLSFETKDDAKTELINKNISEYFVIPKDYIISGLIDRYTLQRQLEAPESNIIAIKYFLISNLLKSENEAVIDRVKAPLSLISTRLTETGDVASDQGGFQTFIIPYLFSILLIISIFFSSGYLLQGLGEEKENRIMEILLSSVSAKQLITGKILGLGAAGLVQILVWLASASLLVNLASSTIGGFISNIHIPTNLLIIGISYFILGYFLFSIISASVGAISPTVREGQQLSTIFTIVAIIPLYFMPIFMNSPNSPIPLIFTLFPLTAPVTVMAMLGLSDIALWQLICSIVLMIVSIAGGLWLTAKIFHTYLLMYGKRPTIREVLRNLKSA